MPITKTGTRPRPLPCSGNVARIAVRVLSAACLLTAAPLLAGCGGESHQPRVASLPTHGGASTHRSAAATQSPNAGIPDPGGRPRQPLNATNAQLAALYVPYTACLRAHDYVDAMSASSRLAVVVKCEHLAPLPAWQVDPSNPQARAFVGRTVACLQARGYHARAALITSDPIQAPSWFINYSPNNLNYAPTRPTGAQDACQQQALR
jgi:hypothetical protein